MDQIPDAEIVNRLRAESPWWHAPHRVGDQFRLLQPRGYLDQFLKLVKQRDVRRATVLMGPRRVGKTVLIHHVIAALLQSGTRPHSIAYVAVDLPLYNGLSLERLLHLAERGSGASLAYVFFDEIQYLPEWETHLKRLVDDNPELRIVVSGSAAATLRLKSRESGAGRFTDFLLPPLTFAEYISLTGSVAEPRWIRGSIPRAENIEQLNDAFMQYANFGGYPEAALNPVVRGDPARFIKGDIIDKVLLRDIPQLHGIGDTQELNRLFTALAWNSAGEVSLEALSSRSGVAKNTLRKYVDYLEAAFLVRIVHRLDRSGTRLQRAASFKVYLTNPSLRSALFAPLRADDERIGALVETAIAAQWFHDGAPIYYARWKDGEVDLVSLDAAHAPAMAMEVKWSDSFVDSPEQLSSLIRFAQEHGMMRVVSTTRTRSAERATGGVIIDFIPAALHAWMVGAKALGIGPTEPDAVQLDLA